jgi:hypothetical protein
MQITATHKIARAVGLAAVALTLAGSAGATFLAGAGSALAPEPAKLVGTTPVSYNGQVGPAAYLSGTATKIVRWPSSGQANRDGSPAAGQPCTTIYLAPGSTTTKVIVALGSSRLCY